MKPSSEEEEAVWGVGPWDECFEVAVQLALRAGQVSGVAASSPKARPKWTAWAYFGRVGGSGASCKDRACVVSGAHLSLALHPLPREGSSMGTPPWGEEGRSLRDAPLTWRWNDQLLGT
ncbi:hypothetical protein NN561_020287 [Cricetulus griseus]